MNKLGKTSTTIEVNNILKEVDLNDDNKISFDEFCKIMDCKTIEELKNAKEGKVEKQNYSKFSRFKTCIDQKNQTLYDNVTEL